MKKLNVRHLQVRLPVFTIEPERSGSSIYEQQDKQQRQQTKSTVSLNGLQRLTGQLKTSSDSVLNRVIWI